MHSIPYLVVIIPLTILLLFDIINLLKKKEVSHILKRTIYLSYPFGVKEATLLFNLSTSCIKLIVTDDIKINYVFSHNSLYRKFFEYLNLYPIYSLSSINEKYSYLVNQNEN